MLCYLLQDQEYIAAIPFPRSTSSLSTTSTNNPTKKSRNRTQIKALLFIQPRSILFTSEVEPRRGGERDLHEVRVLEVVTPGEVIDHRNLSPLLLLLLLRLVLRWRVCPHPGSLRSALRRVSSHPRVHSCLLLG